jgi:hypothetical protein
VLSFFLRRAMLPAHWAEGSTLWSHRRMGVACTPVNTPGSSVRAADGREAPNPGRPIVQDKANSRMAECRLTDGEKGSYMRVVRGLLLQEQSQFSAWLHPARVPATFPRVQPCTRSFEPSPSPAGLRLPPAHVGRGYPDSWGSLGNLGACHRQLETRLAKGGGAHVRRREGERACQGGQGPVCYRARFVTEKPGSISVTGRWNESSGFVEAR